jgi:CheY-like chemotaxis protein
MGEKRLLVCDDEYMFGRFVGRVASTLGYDVELTTHPRDFMDAYFKFQPTAIVLDLVMPDMDGRQVIGWLKRQGCTAPIILVTGYNPEANGYDAQGLPSQDDEPLVTLRKPINVDEMRQALAHH